MHGDMQTENTHLKQERIVVRKEDRFVPISERMKAMLACADREKEVVFPSSFLESAYPTTIVKAFRLL